MSLSIIIVNYRSEQLIIDALDSFLPDSTLGAEVIVVDNDSGTGRLEKIIELFPAVKVLQMGYNAGFARANNEGIRQSSGDIVLLLNPDTLSPKGAIDLSYERFSQSNYVACGVQLLNTDGTPQISGSFFVKGGLNNLLPLPVTGRLVKWLGNQLNVKKPSIFDSDSLVEVDWINGAFLMVKKKAISEAGLLDEDFFLYAEEIEWCSRLRKAGRFCIYGDLKVTHLQGETANQSFGSSGKGYYNLYDKKGLQILVSNFLRIRKQFGIGWFLFQLLFYLAEIPILAIAFLLTIWQHNPRYPLSLLRAYCGNIWRFIQLVPKMLSNKPYFYKVI